MAPLVGEGPALAEGAADRRAGLFLVGEVHRFASNLGEKSPGPGDGRHRDASVPRPRCVVYCPLVPVRCFPRAAVAAIRRMA